MILRITKHHYTKLTIRYKLTTTKDTMDIKNALQVLFVWPPTQLTLV